MSITVPVINLELLNSNENEKEKLFSGLTETGFFYLTGHGISNKLINEIEDISRDFFGASLKQRKRLCREEFRDSGLIHTGNAFYDKAKNERGINVLDVDMIDQTYTRYHDELKNLAFKLLIFIESVLKLEKGVLSSKYCQDPGCFLHCYFYPKGRETPEGSFRIESHTDKGFITLLWQDRVGGLEAKVHEQWTPIPFKEDHFVVNLGDMLEHVTCGVVKATWHRVVYGEYVDRYSWPFFFGLSSDAVMDQLPEFQYNKEKMKMLPLKQPKVGQTFNEWFIENVTSGEDVVDTSGALWRMAVRNGPADVPQLIGVEF